MILQYKGYKNNWCYEEAETVIHSIVWVGKVTREYREGGKKHARYLERLNACETEESKNSLRIKYLQSMRDEIDALIQEETKCHVDIVYHIDCDFDSLENIAVVILQDRNRAITRVFKDCVYLLNSRGQTVHRII